MGYTAENIDNIRKSGNLEEYISHAEKMISVLETSDFEYGKQGENSVSFAHLYGRYAIDVETAEPCAVAWIVYGEWEKRWTLASFDNDQSRACAYARAAIKNKIEEDARELLARYRIDLPRLQAARQAGDPAPN